MSKFIARHGDLSFHPVNKIQGEKVASDKYILALGEHTNHKHIITKQEGTVDIYKDTDGSIFLVIDGKAILTHEEHKPIEMPTGTYRMKIEREYDPFLETIINVQD